MGGDPPRKELQNSYLAVKGNWFLSSPRSGMRQLWLFVAAVTCGENLRLCLGRLLMQ